MENQKSLFDYFKQDKQKNKKILKFADYYLEKLIKEERSKSRCRENRANSSARGKKVILEPIIARTGTGGVLKNLN